MSVPSITTLPRSGLSRPISVLRSTDLPVPEGPSITQISPGGDRQRDVAPDQLLAEGLGQTLDLDLHTHGVRSLVRRLAGHAANVARSSTYPTVPTSSRGEVTATTSDAARHLACRRRRRRAVPDAPEHAEGRAPRRGRPPCVRSAGRRRLRLERVT